ncbi:unnamed protein product [Somion occarium]|uniref:Hemerythrin-like domain-containing protein n=1 Tax=Somion occarium TaxID=3059160 RepID=A0ABP1CJF2_9APHY
MSLFDITNEIIIDHNNVRDLFSRYKSASDLALKTKIAYTLIQEIMIHGNAEEASVYKRFKEFGMSDAAEQDIEDHHEINKLLGDAKVVDPSESTFDQTLSRAVTLFMEHSDEEENAQLNKIAEQIEPEESDKLAKEFLAARKVAAGSMGSPQVELKHSHNA